MDVSDARRRPSRGTAVRVARRLAAQGVEAVALEVVDIAGVTRVKTMPIRRFADVARSGVGLSNVFSVFMADDAIGGALAARQLSRLAAQGLESRGAFELEFFPPMRFAYGPGARA